MEGLGMKKRNALRSYGIHPIGGLVEKKGATEEALEEEKLVEAEEEGEAERLCILLGTPTLDSKRRKAAMRSRIIMLLSGSQSTKYRNF